MLPLTTVLFGDSRIRLATRGRGKYAHTFGGPPDRRGTAREDCGGILIHLLHRFDSTDPALPFRVPGVRWLPVYYCFDFRANGLGYRLLSDDELVTCFPTDDRNVSKEESWPADDYPSVFRKAPIQLTEFDYDPTDLEDAFHWAGVFGIGQLSPADQAVARQRAAEEAEGLGFHVPETDEEFAEALNNPFLQGKPVDACLNPACENRDRKGSLTTVAILPAEPVKGVHTFGKDGSEVRVIVQLCPRCHTFRVGNECD